MTFKDFISITDNKTVRGFVIVKKGDTVIFEKENMIVANGRKYIRELFIMNALSSSPGVPLPYQVQYSGYSLNRLAFGSSGQASTQETDGLVSEISGKRIVLNDSVIEAAPEQLFIKFRGVLNMANEAEGTIVREIGLFLTKPNSTDKLFSRIVFDPIPIEPGESYEVEYYIYF